MINMEEQEQELNKAYKLKDYKRKAQKRQTGNTLNKVWNLLFHFVF